MLESPQVVGRLWGSGSLCWARPDRGSLFGGGKKWQRLHGHLPLLSPTPTALNKQKATLYSRKYTGRPLPPSPGRCRVGGPASDTTSAPSQCPGGGAGSSEQGTQTSSEILGRQVHLCVGPWDQRSSAPPRSRSFLRSRRPELSGDDRGRG